MPLRDRRPLTWTPSGLSDSVDGTNSRPGAMASLSNLIADPSTRGVYVCRPAAVSLAYFPSVPPPEAVSALFVIGDIAYGMVASANFRGFDEPFAFNIRAKTFLPVSGITANNLPVTQPTSGDWTPPTMDALSTYVMVTHPGFLGVQNGFLGWFNLADPANITWSSGNLTIFPLFFPPTFVKVYGARAYYAVGNSTVASDIQFPLRVTNANQVLTFGSSTPITALAGLSLNNQLGGVVEALMVFKESEEGSAIFQVTGDYTGIPSPWQINRLNVSGGTQAANTICSTPFGLAFIDHDGLRVLDLNGNLGDAIGANGDGVTVPFQNAVSPTRMAAAFNRNVYRVTVKNGKVDANPLQEYWYDFTLKEWSGPHSFPVALVAPWRNSFIAANVVTSAFVALGLWRTDVRPSPLSAYVENNAPMTFAWQTVLAPDNRAMRANGVTETNLTMAFIGTDTKPQVTATDTNGTIIGQVTIDPTVGSESLWGNVDWGTVNWGGDGVENSPWNGAKVFWDGNNWDGDVSQMSPWRIAWNAELVFKQIKIGVTGQASAGFRIGNLYMEYQVLGYQQQIGSGVR